MRYYLIIILLTIQITGFCQLSPVLLYNQNESSVFYQYDESPSYKVRSESSRWLMNQLRSPFNYEFVIEGLDERYDTPESFESADAVISNSVDHELYVKRSDNSMALVGERLTKDDITFIKKYRTDQSAFNLLNHDEKSKRVDLRVNLSVDGVEGSSIDYIESYAVSDHQHGTLFLPSLVIDAISSVITVSRSYVGGQVPQIIDASLLDRLFRQDRYKVFINPVDDQVLAIIKISSEGESESILYKSQASDVPVYDPSMKEQFVVYPTISYGDVGVQFFGFKEGAYKLELYSILGTKIWTQTFYVNGNASYSADLSFLPKGNYQYSLIDPNGYRVLSKRLGIIKY